MSAPWSLLLFLMVVRSSFGEKQDENNEIHRAIEKIDELDNSFNELKEMSIDNSLYDASSDVVAALTERDEGDASRSRTRRENESIHLGNVFHALHDIAIQTSARVRVLLESQAFCRRPKSCLEHLRCGHTESGVYKIYTATYAGELEVFCDQETDGGGWLVFQRRQDGSEDFYRNWLEYEAGFGDLEGEFWLGNDYLHRLTFGNWQELRIDLGDFDNKNAFAKYTKFMIGSKSSNYVLTVEGYSGDVKDSLTRHNGEQFSTKDKDNDRMPGPSSCSEVKKGGWWYDSCADSNLNGLYNTDKQSKNINNIFWYYFKSGFYPLKFTEMKFREHDRN